LGIDAIKGCPQRERQDSVVVVNTAMAGRNTRDSNRLNNRAIFQPYGVRK